MNLTGKIALVTGGTKGIGAATAIALAKEGTDIALNCRRLDADAAATRDAVAALGRRCVLVHGDCGKADDCARIVRETESDLGPVDVLVHSAGGAVNGKLLEITPSQWMDAFNVHVHAIYHLSCAVVPGMKLKKEGAIITLSSTAGIRALVTNIAYQAAKGAIPQITRGLARELAEDNIRVNCVAPGVIRTDFHKHMSAEQKRLNLEHRIPLHREGTPAQVADAILMLIKNDYITGETVVIDGGLTMRIA
ncbi:MAG: SDR family oxidoreductase [Pedosphaera sp.]|nr:SDR family oxidoreductase [Pedosphaera sp.]